MSAGARLSLGSCCLSVLLCAHPSPIAALDPAKAVTQYVHDFWDTEQGLPQVSVLAVTQTRDGYLWAGTQEGLVRFDGVRFRVFDRANTPELKSNYVLSLQEDAAGALWIGTYGGGLTRFRSGAFKTFTTAEGLASDIVWSLIDDGKGGLWVGTAGGLNRIEGGRPARVPALDGLPGAVVSLARDNVGDLWIGRSEGGLAVLRGVGVVQHTSRNGLPVDVVKSVHAARDGGVWVGTRGGGLARWRDGRWTRYTTRDGLSSDFVAAVFEDREGTLWMGLDGGGITRFRDGRFSVYSKPEGLSSDAVRSFYEDREGSLWIGTYGGGLNRLQDGPFSVYTTREGLSGDIVSPVLEDRGGALWVGTAGTGLNRLVDGTSTAFTTRQGMSSDSITSLAEDREGAIWVGTSGGGLNRIREESVTRHVLGGGLGVHLLRALYQDREGSLWIGSDGGGLGRLHAGILMAYRVGDGLPSDTVFALLQDQRGALWIGTEGGLARYLDGRFTVYTTREGLPSNLILSLHEDGEGVLWVGTGGGGLARLKKGRFTTYSSREGLFDDVVFRILEDSQRRLWMSSNKGVFRVTKAELDSFAEGRIASFTSVAYGRADGMKNPECNGRFQPAGWKTRDGRLWFPTMKGLVVVDPDRVRANTLVPPVLIEEVLVDQRVVPAAPFPQLPARSVSLELHYTALTLRAPEKVHFKYRLDSIDRDWVSAGTRRVAYYTNLPPGNHRFRVMARNAEGVWSTQAAQYRFRLEPRFHQTAWFFLASVLSVALALWGAHRVRMRFIQAHAGILEERNRIAQEIHDSLAQGLSGIIFQIEATRSVLRGGEEDAVKRLADTAALARQTLDEARRSVWALRPSLLEEGNLSEALSSVVQQYAANANARVDLEVFGPVRRIPETVEIGLLRIAQEAVANAIEHGLPQQVQVELRYERRAVQLRVRDDGTGFSPHEASAARGFGLRGMRRRANALGGRLRVRSRLGTGTEVSVSVPSRVEAWDRIYGLLRKLVPLRRSR